MICIIQIIYNESNKSFILASTSLVRVEYFNRFVLHGQSIFVNILTDSLLFILYITRCDTLLLRANKRQTRRHE